MTAVFIMIYDPQFFMDENSKMSAPGRVKNWHAQQDTLQRDPVLILSDELLEISRLGFMVYSTQALCKIHNGKDLAIWLYMEDDEGFAWSVFSIPVS